MKMSLSVNALENYIKSQLSHFFPDGLLDNEALGECLKRAVNRLEYSFSQIKKKYYYDNDHPVFNHLNGDHYAALIYFLSNEAYLADSIHLAEKCFLLNKSLHGLDAFYSISLPEVFLFVHPLGTVLGHADYGNYFVVYQNVTIGTEVGQPYPVFGEGVVLYSKCSVIGESVIGDNVAVSMSSIIRNTAIASNQIVLGSSPNNVLKTMSKNNKALFFDND